MVIIVIFFESNVVFLRPPVDIAINKSRGSVVCCRLSPFVAVCRVRRGGKPGIFFTDTEML